MIQGFTLHQPWASLVADGYKTVETRSWPAPPGHIGHQLAIHAGKTLIGQSDAPEAWGPYEDQLFTSMPKGAVVAIATLDDVLVIRGRQGPAPFTGIHLAVCRSLSKEGTEDIYVEVDPYGDFGVNRYLWMLRDVIPMAQPIPCSGHQRLWGLPLGIESEIKKQVRIWKGG